MKQCKELRPYSRRKDGPEDPLDAVVGDLPYVTRESCLLLQSGRGVSGGTIGECSYTGRESPPVAPCTPLSHLSTTFFDGGSRDSTGGTGGSHL